MEGGKKLKPIVPVPTKERIRKGLVIPLWLLGYFVFLIFGGLIITVIEESNEKSIKNDERLRLLGVLEKYNKSSNDTMILEIIEAAVSAYSVKGLNLKDLNAEVPSTWGFSGGLFFCATLVTTIGYGDRYPRTTGGRWFTIIYAIVGIPFTGILLAKIGMKLTDLIKTLDCKVTKVVKKIMGKINKEEKLRMYVRLFQILVVLGIFILTFWFIPAIIMVETEGWDYTTAIYYCFVTITTIGLGDVVIGTSTDNINADFSMTSVQTAAMQVSILIYFILGLSALSIILNLVKSAMNNVATSAKIKAENFSYKSMKILGIGSNQRQPNGSNCIADIENKAEKVGVVERKLGKISEEEHVDEPSLGLGFWDQGIEEDSNESILNLGYGQVEKTNEKPHEERNEEILTGRDSRLSISSRNGLVREEKGRSELPKVD